MTKFTVLPLSVLLLLLFICTQSSAKSVKPDKSDKSDENELVGPSCCGFSSPLLIKTDQWEPIFSSKFGAISTVQIGDGCGGMGPYKIHSITLEPNTLMLPILLHSDMVFFVESGSGTLNWVDAEATNSQIKRGDVYRLLPGSVFFLQSKPVDIYLGTKLRLYAIFSDNQECLHDPCFGAYSSITDLFFGFDQTILKSAFGVPEDIIGLMQNRTQPPLIVQDTLSTPANANMWPRLLKLFAGDVSADSVMESAENKKKAKKEKKEKKEKKPKTKEAKTFNVFESEPDFESPNGRTITINTKDLKVLSGSTVGVFMVNLTQGSMMGPHWNPWACEISIVLKGSGMVRVLRNSVSKSSSECENSRFKVEEGDIFAVPRLHPMAQMSFISDSLVFVGFTTSAKNNEPQFLAGKTSALRLLDREVLAASFNVSTVMIDGLLGAQKEAVVLGCPFCAEGELKRLESEKAKKEEEERKKREAEEEKQWPPQPQPQPQKPPQPFQPEQPGEGPQEPQQPGGGPQEPQRPGEGPQEPQQPGEGPKEPQQPGGGPQEPQQPGGGPQEPAKPKTEAEKRDAERKREEEQAKKEEEERLWPPQPQ